METASERDVEQIIDVPMPQIVEEIFEVEQIDEQIDDVPAPHIELVFLVVLILFFFCAVAWNVAHFFDFTSLDLAVSMSDCFFL